MNSVFHKIKTSMVICYVPKKVFGTILFLSFLFLLESVCVGTMEVLETCFSS